MTARVGGGESANAIDIGARKEKKQAIGISHTALGIAETWAICKTVVEGVWIIRRMLITTLGFPSPRFSEMWTGNKTFASKRGLATGSVASAPQTG